MGPRPRLPVRSGTPFLIAIALCSVAVAPSAIAQSTPAPRIYQCTLADGRKVTSDKPIVECMSAGKAQRELNQDGSQKGLFEAPPTEDEKVERERIQRQRDSERTAQEIEARRDRDLTKRYPNEAAHAKARARALDDVATSVQHSEARIKLLLQERKPLLDEAEFYVGKPLPPRLKLALDGNDAALEAQRSLVQNQQTEIVRVNKLYDDELARLRKLWAGAPPGTLGPVSAASLTPAVAPATVPANTANVANTANTANTAGNRRPASAPR